MARTAQTARAAARFIKLDSTGKQLGPRARAWVAVLDATTDLIWSRDYVPGGRMNWKAAVSAAAKFDLCGKPARAPTRAELLTLVDDTRVSPAIDVHFFPECRSAWEWTSTPLASSPSDCAWGVGFGYGYSDWNSQGSEGFVRAVRPGQSLALGSAKRKAARR